MFDTRFFEPAFELYVRHAIDLAAGHLEFGDPSAKLAGLCPANEPAQDALCFVDNPGQVSANLSIVGAVLCRLDTADQLPNVGAVIAVENPQSAFAHIVSQLFPASMRGVTLSGPFLQSDPMQWDISVSQSANIESDVVIMPGARIGADVEIGTGSRIGANAVIADNVKIGRNCSVGAGCVVQCSLIGDHVTIHPGCMIGQDGFGYMPSPKGIAKMPHIGRVIVQDDVEIGANTTVDRGTIGDTVIGQGTKIDNLVQIAHNVKLGRHVILCGQVGLSGSCEIGDGAMLGGSVGVSNGVRVGMGTQIAATSGVMHDIPDGEKWAGTPAQPIRSFFKEQAALRRLAKGDKRG